MKKFLSIVLALAIACVMLSQGMFSVIGASTDPVVSLGNVTVEHGATTVRVPVNIKNNPGVITLMLEIYYARDYFTLKGVEYNSASGFGKTAGTDKYSQYPFRMIVGDDTAKKNNTFNGTIATLVFEIHSTAPADLGYDVGVETNFSGGAYTLDANLAPVKFASEYGSIWIASPPTAVPTAVPTRVPTAAPTGSPTVAPTTAPGGSTTAPGGSTTAPDGATTAPGGATTVPGGSTTAPDGSTTVPGGSTVGPVAPDITTAPGGATVRPTNVPISTKAPVDDSQNAGPGGVYPTNVPVTTPEGQNPDTGSTTAPGTTADPSVTTAPGDVSDVPGQTSSPDSTDDPNGDGSQAGADGEKTPAPDGADDGGCNNVTTAWIVIVALAVLCAVVITLIWAGYKKKNTAAATSAENAEK